MLFYVIAAIAGAVIGIAIYIVVVRLVAKGHADAIIEKANAEAENIKQQKIFQAKEKFLQLKSEHDKYVNNKNSELMPAMFSSSLLTCWVSLSHSSILASTFWR